MGICLGKKPKQIRQNALVRFKPSREKDWHYYPFTSKDTFVYLGDIAQMTGHCVVVRNQDGRIFTCYHTDDFYELKDEEA